MFRDLSFPRVYDVVRELKHREVRTAAVSPTSGSPSSTVWSQQIKYCAESPFTFIFQCFCLLDLLVPGALHVENAHLSIDGNTIFESNYAYVGGGEIR